MESSKEAYSTTPSLNAQRTYWKTGQKDCEKPRAREAAMRLNLLEMTGKHNPQYLNNMTALKRSEKINY